MQIQGAKITTGEFAEALRVKPDTIRRGLCVNGHYMGERPNKLPNGRLLWDAEAPRRIIIGTGADTRPGARVGILTR